MRFIRKSVSFLLILSLLVSVVTCGFTTGVSAATVTIMYIEGTDVGVRTGPGTEYSIIERVDNRSATVINSNPTQDAAGSYYWYNITYHNGTEKITGWVAYDESYIRIVTYNPDANFEETLNAFPESYRDALRALHAEYPNWKFIPDPVNIAFNEIVYLESLNMRKQVSFTSQPVSWRSMGPGAYDWNKGGWIQSNGGWTGASKETIAYYMDPRNFLNADDIYMFLQQGYDASMQTEEGVRSIIAGTFMATNYSDPNDTAYGGDYAKVIMAAAQSSGVSPYIIAAKIRQEIGTSGTSSLISGNYNEEYKGYYNFFNINATGSTQTEVIVNGLSYAKAKGWNTRSAAIIGGASWYSSDYISGGQDTYYYQDFNVHNIDRLWKQYAQAVHDAYSKGRGVRNVYQTQKGFTLTFRIPIFLNMPVSAVDMPESNSKKNNYYLSEMSVSGLTPSFEKFTYSYSLRVTGDTAIKVTPIESSASISSPQSYSLQAGNNTVVITVKAESGYTTDYTVSVYADKACTLYVNSTGTIPGGGSQPTVTVKKGDTNGDGQITLRDLANVRLHLLGLISLSGNNLTGADTNGDGQIALRDLANIRLHLLGLINLTV